MTNAIDTITRGNSRKLAELSDAEWGCWVVYDMNNIRAVYPDELSALRCAQSSGFYMYVKWVPAGLFEDTLK